MMMGNMLMYMNHIKIDDIVKEKCADDIARVVEVYPGYYSTHIIVE